MNAVLLQLISGLANKEPALDVALKSFTEKNQIFLPEEYIQFLRLKNGGEGFVGQNAYVMFWGLDELAEMNNAYNVKEYVPGLYLFGSDGGGEAYAFDTRSEMAIVKVPFVGMDISLIENIATTFI